MVRGVIRPLTNDRVWVLVNAFPEFKSDGQIRQVVVTFVDITQRKRAEEALRASEEKYRLLIENQNDMVVKFDRDHKMQFLSPSYCKTFGVKEDHILGKNFRPLVHKDDIETVKSSIATLKKPPHTAYHEERAKAVDGWRCFGWSLKAIVNEAGEINETIAVGRDISERRRAEREIAKAADEWQKTFDATNDIIFILDKEHRILRFNKTASFFFKMPEAEIVGKSCWGIVHGTKHPISECPISSVKKTLYRKKVELRLNERWHELTVDPILDENGEYGGAVHILTDISERKQSEQALRLSEEKFAKAFQNAPMLMTISSMKNGRYIDVNEAFVRVTGYNRETAIGRRSVDLGFITHKDRNRLSEILTAEGRVPEMELNLIGVDGSEIICRYSGEIIELENEKRLFSIASDITESKRLEFKLQQAQKMEAIGTLAGGIAHDFNNILGGIIGYAELAKMKAPEGSNVIAYLDKMIKSSDRAADLIKQILTLSRRHKQKQRPVQVRHIVKEALDLLRATLPTTIEIRKDVAKDTGVVNADPTQMHQVIMNLTTNAGHAMQENGGVLEVTLANVELDDLEAAKHLDLDAGSYLRLMVSDTGYGMSSEIMERIFDPYFTTKDTGEGTGLGLAVAQGIVKAHGGTITVYSEPGKGTTFHVYLPVILELEREEKGSEEPLPTGSESILFIDDEEVLIEIGGQILEHLGYKVVTEKSSVQALELFRAEPDRFDLVITDMTMPHMTGDKFARELMKIRPHISVILCTGHSTLVLEEKAKDIGIRAFVMKPLVMRNLAETVRKVLDEK